MYPLNMHNAKVGGFAVANTEDEHKRLSEMGYEPKFVAPEPAPKKAKPAKDAE
jgi:hypothetical protein